MIGSNRREAYGGMVLYVLMFLSLLSTMFYVNFFRAMMFVVQGFIRPYTRETSKLPPEFFVLPRFSPFSFFLFPFALCLLPFALIFLFCNPHTASVYNSAKFVGLLSEKA